MSVYRKTALGLFFLAVLGVLSQPPARAESDTPADRRAAAERYFEVAHFDELMDNMILEMAARHAPSPAAKQRFIEFMHRQINPAAMEKLMVDVAIQYFTTTELNALADFYGTPEGQSIIRKLPVFMGAVMPVMIQEMARTAGEYQPEP
jgi:uncharacterized protein